MGRFYCDSAAIRRWKFGPWGFFALTRVAPIHRASFCIQPYLNGSKRFFVQCLAPGQSKQCLHDSTISIILSTFSTIGLPERGASLTSKLLERNRRNQNCAILTVTVSGHKHYSHFQPPGLRFRLYRRKTVKYGVFSLRWCHFWRSNNTDSSNHKTVWEVFLIRNLIFLTPFGVTRSHLYNARHRLLKPSIGKIIDFFLLHLIIEKNKLFYNNFFLFSI